MKIGFSYPKKFIIGAYLISKWMNKPYSHVFIEFDNQIFHAAHGCVHFLDKLEFESVNHIIKEYEMITNEQLQIYDYCETLVGIEYGYIELLKNIINDICHNFGLNIWFPNARGFICSELVGYIGFKYFNFKFNKPLNLIEPNDVENALENKN